MNMKKLKPRKKLLLAAGAAIMLAGLLGGLLPSALAGDGVPYNSGYLVPVGDATYYSPDPQTLGDISSMQLGHEVMERRTENSKTYYLGNNRYGIEISSSLLHYKNNYADAAERWKDIDLTIKDGRLTTAPYILEIGEAVRFTDKKTGDSIVISPSKIGSADASLSDISVIPYPEGVKLQRTISSDRGALTSVWDIDVKGTSVQIRANAEDANGEHIPVEYSVKDGKLTETVKPELAAKPTHYPIKVDPDLTVQPSSKDTQMAAGAPTTNYGSNAAMTLYNYSAGAYRDILEFDISALPEVDSIDVATMSLYYYAYAYTNPVGLTVWAYKMTRTDWVELEATWNIYKTGSNWTTAGGDYVTSSPAGGSTTIPAGYGWMAWNVLAIVQDAYTNTNPVEILTRWANEAVSYAARSTATFYSRDYVTDTTKCPKLYIEYTEMVTVVALAATNITHNSARLHGNVTNDGGESCEAQFRWSLRGAGNWTETSWQNSLVTGDTFYHDLSGLTANCTDYEYQARGNNSAGVGDWSASVEFETQTECPVPKIAKINGVAWGDIGKIADVPRM